MKPHPPTITASAMKTVYLIRHGVAKHNVPDQRTGKHPDIANDTNLTDPTLINQGILQARVLGENLKRSAVRDTVDLVVCSPLSRCIQTAGYIFPDHFRRIPQDSALSNALCDDLVTRMGESTEGHHVVLNSDCKVFCHEDVREAFGMHYPDKRR